MAELGFWEVAKKRPSMLALVEPDGRGHTAEELFASSNQATHGLRELGLEPGDTVATLLPNSAAQMEAYLACFQSGWYLVPINYHLTASEIAYIVQDCDAAAFISDERFGDTARGAVEEIGFPEDRWFVAGSEDGVRSYDTLKDGQPESLPEERQTGSTMTYTAGTTGRPKGVRRPILVPDPDLAGEMFTWFLFLFGIQPFDDNVHLVVSPMYHTAVQSFSTASLHMGHTIVHMDKWTPEGTLERIERYRVTTSHMVPTQFHRLLALPKEERDRFDVSSLRTMVHSAAPCPVEVKQRMLDWWGPVIYEYYAATEGGGTLVTPEEWLKKPGTVGKPWPMSEVRVLDDEGNEPPTGDPGTVWMRMGDYTFEYHKDKEKTASTWREGFFTVGDVGYMDEDGFLFLCDRKVDMIISGGVNIYPAEVESALLTHPKVGDAAVFGIPDEDWGEQVKGVVQPAEGVAAGPDLEQELLAWCKQKVAAYKCPRSIDFLPELPRDPNGKLYKRKLRDPYWQKRERAI